jgi:hypothetical protein
MTTASQLPLPPATIALFLPAAAVPAQSTASIEGLIVDWIGAFIPGVEIRVGSSAVGIGRVTATDDVGEISDRSPACLGLSP